MSTEQIPTSIKLLQIETNKRYEGAVIMLQHIPQVSTTSFNNQRWNELKILTDTLQIKEVTNPNLTENNLLHRLYNEYEIMIFENRKIYDKCRCSHLRALNVLRALSKDEIEKLKIDGKVIVKCQYCLKENIFEDL
jgi:molecular chaperone Hsp33